ncbi:MAG: type II toxin-antitoxin system VapC family toxin [Bacteroidales bacterium]|nr:type II toxin-antitoxin system VapC family toxin [Bacteroidales bacterium]
MKRYLLDTNICIFFIRGMYDIDKFILERGEENCFISDITVAELLYGAKKSNNPNKSLQITSEFINSFSVVHIYDSLETYADNRVLLEKQGQKLDDFDLLIGSTAVKNNMIMVTDNVKHLARIPDINIENWIER